MRRTSQFLVVLASWFATPARAQQWNEPRALTLVRQATERRAQQLADSGLVDYRAVAHGYLTFLAQLGEGFREPPQVVKADELALQVYWRSPNLSKQMIVGRRDTTLLPTDIQYHRDHLGIVQNNFPAIIRLGDGDEVQDVPHPLSAPGLETYDFAVSDSLTITTPGRTIRVYEVKVRPRNDREPRIIGALYLDRDNAQVVRMAFSFTRVAYLDKQLEDLFIVLENGLVASRFWLPRRQEIEIRRTATWMDYPVRGIIRGRWEIADYQVNAGIARTVFFGPEIVQATPQVMQSHEWPSARILDSLPPDVRLVTAEEIRRVQAEARALVREQALRRTRGSALAARGISDFARFNRVEGVALGGGLSWQLGSGLTLSGRARYGFEDREGKGGADLRWEGATGFAVRAHVARDLRDVGDVAERSTFVNSIAAQEFGSDFTELFAMESGGLELAWRRESSTTRLDVSAERERGLVPHARPAAGRFELPIVAASIGGVTATLTTERPWSLTYGGFESRERAMAAVSRLRSEAALPATRPTTVVRGSFDLELQRPLGDARLVTRMIAAGIALADWTPIQALVFLGGPMTAPGYDYHSLVASEALSQRVELQIPVPFPSVSLGRFGRSAARATLAPFVSAVAMRSARARSVLSPALDPSADARVFRRASGVYPSVGVGLLTFFDLLRLDVARGLKNGRWSFYIDVNRAFWSVL